jgi:hypothetical protein
VTDNKNARLPLLIVAASLVSAGCSAGSQTTAGALPQSAAASPHRGISSAKRLGDLIYVSSYRPGEVYIYTYPRGHYVNTIGKLGQYLGGECSDRAGNVYVATSTSDHVSTIYKFGHGDASPIATFADQGQASGCAVDPSTGDLAVSNLQDDSSNNPYPGNGDVAVFPRARGNPSMYYTSAYRGFYFCGYDNGGNLYLSASEDYHSGESFLVRLKSDSGSFEPINVDATIYGEASVQWDGAHIAISSYTNVDERGSVIIDRLAISGRSATVLGTTTLHSAAGHHKGQLWIAKDRVVGIDHYHGDANVSIWPYPLGGASRHTISHVGSDDDRDLWGVTVSVAH